MTSKNILIGRESIKRYIGITADKALDDFIKLGLPHLVQKNRYYATTDNIDRFFNELTTFQGPPDPNAT